jgi:hypothetical protein
VFTGKPVLDVLCPKKDPFRKVIVKTAKIPIPIKKIFCVEISIISDVQHKN